MRISVVLAVFAVCSVTMARKLTPSSMRKTGASIRFTHVHQRVNGCKSEAKTKSCVEQRGTAAAGTTLALTPVLDQLVDESSASRVPVNVSLPEVLGSSSLEQRLDPGLWRLAWADQSATFNVISEQGFRLGLKTVSGRCVPEKDGCELRDEAVRREVSIPPEFRAEDQ